ncbi:MAG: hypothetical protein SFU98_14845 [Leptospiraceae bacterium]|nr:hypothetical protein [Leptospiraceae bacterium]
MSSPSMTEYQTYKHRINSIIFFDRFQPEESNLEFQLKTVLSNTKLTYLDSIKLIKIISVLICFIDDHSEIYPRFCFDEEKIPRLIEWMRASKTTLTIPEILESKILDSTECTIEKLLIVHATLRLLARGRDFRAFNNYQLTLEERILISRNIAPFDPSVSNGGDPLGDSYHYLANFIIGIIFGNRPLIQKFPILLFFMGPYLMKAIREFFFGNILFFGNHSTIDHMGLKHGIRISKRLYNSTCVS